MHPVRLVAQHFRNTHGIRGLSSHCRRPGRSSRPFYPDIRGIHVNTPCGRIRLQLLEPSKLSSTALNVAVFHSTKSSTPTSLPRANTGPVATSGAYSDPLAGVVTPLVTLAQGTYEIIPSTYSPDIQAAFRLIMYLSVSGVEVRRIQSK
jgi:hypothetical protein